MTASTRRLIRVGAITTLLGIIPIAAPQDIRAERIAVDGTTLRFSDATDADLRSNPAAAPGFAAINNMVGALTSVRGYYDASAGVLAGRAYGTEASGLENSPAVEGRMPDASVP